MEALRTEGIGRHFGGVRVLHEVSFSLPVGEKAAIIGPNGAGKTTLFNVIDGQLAPSAGEVFLFGRRITDLPVHQRSRLGLARSFQTSSLFPDLSVLENVLLALYGVGGSRFVMMRRVEREGRLVERAERLLATVNLVDRQGERAKDLSHGEQRRLEIALTLASEPRVLMLDEPSAGLTAGESAQVVELVHALPPDTTLLVVAHDMDLVLGVADRIIVLHNGEIVADGLPEVVRCDPRVSEIYVGT